jgi:hypothetical protein
MNATFRSIARAAMTAVPLLLFLSCMSRQGISRDVRASGGPEVEITGTGAPLLRSIYCDILAEPVDEEMWDRLFASGIFANGRTHRRVPPFTAFQVVLKSTVNAPLRLKDARLLYGKSVLSAMNAERIGERMRSPSYRGLDPGRMRTLRRVVRDGELRERMDYDHDSIELKLDFVPPRDTVMAFLFFEKIPAEIKAFRLRLTITALGTDKSFDVDFTRYESRAGSEDALWRKKRERAGDDE